MLVFFLKVPVPTTLNFKATETEQISTRVMPTKDYFEITYFTADFTVSYLLKGLSLMTPKILAKNSRTKVASPGAALNSICTGPSQETMKRMARLLSSGLQ